MRAKSPIDRELESVVTRTGDEAAFEARARQASSGQQHSVTLLALLLTMSAGIVALVMTSFNDAAVYSKSVEQVLKGGAALKNRRLRVEGNLVHNSLSFRNQPCEYRFKIGKAESTMEVRFPQCVLPDTFRDVPNADVAATVEGKLAPEGYFDATTVLAKCPSKYEMKNGTQVPVGWPSSPASAKVD
jgi:cytochrome c-type biogenesis protein CcmE